MQKQSFELITHVSKKVKTHQITFSNTYPVVFFLFLSIPRIWFRLIKNPQINLIHANDGLMALFLTPLLLLKRRRLSATIHGLDIVFRFAPFQFWARNFLSQFDLLIAVSDATKSECIKRGISQDRIICIPNGFEIPVETKKNSKSEWFRTNIDQQVGFILTSVGRPVPRKGFSWFAKHVLPALKVKCTYFLVGPELKNSGTIHFLEKWLPSWFFEKYCILNGIPLDYIELKKLAIQPKNEVKIVMLGKLSNEQLSELYRHTDLFLMPNLKVEGDFEGFGLVALEAASREALCLAADVDGIPTAIKNNSTGILLESGNPDLWVAKINELLSTDFKSISGKFSKNVINQNYTWEKMSLDYLEAFEKLNRQNTDS